jgi:hypothetical protein
MPILKSHRKKCHILVVVADQGLPIIWFIVREEVGSTHRVEPILKLS